MSVKTVKVGVMPGRVNEFAVEVGSSIADVLAFAELSPAGFEVKVDGTKVTDFNATKITSSTNLILLAKQVKGNTDTTVKVGVMPGRVNEFVVNSASTIADVLTLAELSADGYEVKADGTKITDFNQAIGSTRLILLAKQVKGNADTTVKVGVMPGRVNEFVVDNDSSFKSVLELAGLNADGYEVKADGTKITNFDAPIGATRLILLTKQVKGNN